MSIVSEFSLFRQKKWREQMEAKSNEVDIDILTKEVVEKLRQRAEEHPTPPTRIAGSGATLSAVRALEGRIKAVEGAVQVTTNYLSFSGSGTTTLTKSQLTGGINIIGLTLTGPMTVRLPDDLTQGTIIEIKDESLNADTYNITVETYNT